MNPNTLWSLRLGFSNNQATVIEKLGLENFLKESFSVPFDSNLPDFLASSPKNLIELKDFKQKIKDASPEEKKQLNKDNKEINLEMKSWWLNKMIESDFPLKEKMTCFWHNHFVATHQKVKVNYWIFQHNQILRENAFGNFKELTKKIVKSNAIVFYLDNKDNKNGKINENLSRELLELFTIGIGNYTEEDIKNGAKGLAGLGLGENEAVYHKRDQDNDPIEYFGKKGVFKIDEMIDIIFEQKNIPYLITRKILKWFIYDDPNEKLVTYYGNYFRSVNFEIKPLLTKIFTEEYKKNNAGSKIKSPLEYSMQLIAELNVALKDMQYLSKFLNQQNMDLFDQPNVKGWDGGKSWITPQVYMQRNNLGYLLSNGKFINRKVLNGADNVENNKGKEISTQLKWTSGSNLEIIKELTDRLLFEVDADSQKDFESILKYDFNANAQNANQAVLRLFTAMIKLPEFQLI